LDTVSKHRAHLPHVKRLVYRSCLHRIWC